MVFDRCHLFTNSINCLSTAPTEPEQIQNNLCVSFPGLAVELYLAFATWFAFCRTRCLHDQLTCFTNIFLATAYKLAFFCVFGKGFLKRSQRYSSIWACCAMPGSWHKEHAKSSFAVFLSALSLLWILQLSSCVSSPLTVPSQPCFLFSTQLRGAETAPRNISQPCGLLHTVRKQQHPSCLCKRPKCVPQSLILASSLLHIGLSLLSLFLREVNNSWSTNYRLPW